MTKNHFEAINNPRQRIRWENALSVVSNPFFSISRKFLYMYLYFFKKNGISELFARGILDNKKNDKFLFNCGNVQFYGPSITGDVNDVGYYYRGCGTVLIESFFHGALIIPSFARPCKGAVCLDLGANVGTVSLVLSKMIGKNGRVFGFEPIYADTAIENLKMNSEFCNWEIFPEAVTDRSGEKVCFEESEFFLDTRIRMSDFPQDKRKPLTREVATITIDDFVEKNKITSVDFIKIDIEGAEYAALKGAEKVLKKFKPVLSISSYHLDLVDKIPQHNKLCELLKELEYSYVEIPNFHIWAGRI